MLDIEENDVHEIDSVRFVFNKRYGEPTSLKNGPWGLMVNAKYLASKQPVTIHQVRGIFEKKTKDSAQLLHTIKRLREMKGQPHLLNIFDLYSDPSTRVPTDGHIDYPHNSRTFVRDLYIVTRYVDTDLSAYLHADSGLSSSEYQYILFQLLRGAQNLHDTVHLSVGDIQPTKIVGQQSTKEFMYTTFGLVDEARLSFRPPERLHLEVSLSDYCSSDIWTIGCLFAALLCKKSSFFEGDSVHELETDMVRKLGWKMLDREETWKFLKQIRSPAYDEFLSIIDREEHTHDDVPSARFSSYFPPGTSPEALDLLLQMLQPVPERRITISDALRHSYLQDYYNPFTDFRDPRKLEEQNIVPTHANPVHHLPKITEGSTLMASEYDPHSVVSKSKSTPRILPISVCLLEEEENLSAVMLEQLWYEEIVKYRHQFQQQPRVYQHPISISQPPALTPAPIADEVRHIPHHVSGHEYQPDDVKIDRPQHSHDSHPQTLHAPLSSSEPLHHSHHHTHSSAIADDDKESITHHHTHYHDHDHDSKDNCCGDKNPTSSSHYSRESHDIHGHLAKLDKDRDYEDAKHSFHDHDHPHDHEHDHDIAESKEPSHYHSAEHHPHHSHDHDLDDLEEKHFEEKHHRK